MKFRNVRLYRLDDDGKPTGPPIETEAAFVEVHTPDPIPCVDPVVVTAADLTINFDMKLCDPALFRLVAGHPWYRVDFDLLVAPRVTRALDLVAAIRSRVRQRAAWFAEVIRAARG